MGGKLKNDSTATFRPIIYQFYVALEKCFDLLEGESVFVESYGDVTITGKSQIEVKDYSDNLTDAHENLWKTLKNWLNEDFKISHYKNLILHTTQSIGPESLLTNWNAKNASEKEEILRRIYNTYCKRKKKSPSTLGLLEKVLSEENKGKLSKILDKFLILDSSENDVALYETLKQKHCKVLSVKKGEFLDALLGFIINPKITASGWEITYEDFNKKCSSLVEEYSSMTKIFPKKHSNAIVSDSEQLEYKDYQFVRKIKDIDYIDVVGEAITDFVNTRKTITEELSEYKLGIDQYDIYQKELHRNYLTKYRQASRETSIGRLINDSKNFYDSIIGSPVQSFRNYNDTPLFFRNGLLHELAELGTDGTNVIWKLDLRDE